METKKSDVVKKVLHNTGQFTNSYGVMYKHEIRFENGDVGIYNSKSETCTKFVEGQKAFYSIEANGKYLAKIKPVQEETPSAPANTTTNKPLDIQTNIMRQCAIKCSCQLHSQSMAANDIKKVIEDADEIFKWMIK